MKKPFENKTNSPIYVAGQMIPPGEICMVEVPDEPATGPAEAPAPTLADQVALLLKGKVEDIVKGLPELTADALTMMTALENQSKKPRVSLLTAIGNAQIALADAKLQSDDLDAPVPGTEPGTNSGEQTPAGQ